MDTKWHLDEDEQEDGFRHIWPNPDLGKHKLLGVDCWCSPTINLEYNLVIHNRVE